MSDLKFDNFEMDEVVVIDGKLGTIKVMNPSEKTITCIDEANFTTVVREGAWGWDLLKKAVPDKAERVSKRVKLPPLATEVIPPDQEIEHLERIIIELIKKLYPAVQHNGAVPV